jgi:uncharacterized protein
LPNHLINSLSPYLIQHAQNPVNWFPWDLEALELAKRLNKPIFLSIGYAACHWCHVMAHESFEDPQIAAFMNQNFICIKVDREERPDIDSIYMTATVALTGSGGWPTSIFLTPDLKPFYAGTYFPPARRFNLPSFLEILTAVAAAWENERENVIDSGERITSYLESQISQKNQDIPLSQEHLKTATQSLINSYDWGYGGWGTAPKFPQPMAIEFLFRRHYAGNKNALKAAIHALRAMTAGGMYDVIGGGFSRYSTDNFWRVPHFEKMLYDNALLSRVYLHGWQITGDLTFRRVVEQTLGFISREMSSPEGGFYSSLDADSDGAEGKYYTWTAGEIENVLRDDYNFFQAAYGLTEQGNWEGKTVLQRNLDDHTLADRFSLAPADVTEKLRDCHAKLLALREKRIRPGVDDKVLTAWNGFMLATFAEAARTIDNENLKKHYLNVATRSAGFLLTSLQSEGQLRRSWRKGATTKQVFLEDYASLILGLLELYQTDFNTHWFVSASDLSKEMIQRFHDPMGGFFDTAIEGESLVVRPKDLQDNATPSGNALACEALLKLAAFSEFSKFRDLAEESLAAMAEVATQHPTTFSHWLSVMNFSIAHVKQVALLSGDTSPLSQEMLHLVQRSFRPNLVIAYAQTPLSHGVPELLQGRKLLKGLPTAYVCDGFACKLPVTSVKALEQQLSE